LEDDAMRNRREVEWLMGEIPSLMGAGVLGEDAAARLRAHYGAGGATRRGRSVALTALSVLGALLIGSGVVLLIAHNWGDLSRGMRTAISLAPLLVCQGLALYGAARDKGSTAWRETIGLLWSLGTAAAIALIGQTYHLPGEMRSFLLTWMLLTLPVVYLLRSVSAASLYLVGIAAWSAHALFGERQAIGYWLLLAAVLPFADRLRREAPGALRTAWLFWVGGLSICFATGFTLERTLPGLWVIIYSGLFSASYLIGASRSGRDGVAWRLPLTAIGGAGVAILSLILSYQWPWREIGWHHYANDTGTWREVCDYLLLAAFPVLAVVLAVRSAGERRLLDALFGIMPLVAVPAYAVVAQSDSRGLAQLLFNGYLFAIGIALLARGVAASALAPLNAGMLALGVLIVARFFDSDLSLVMRGVTFIVLGVVFLGTNLTMLRRRGGAS
jgi:uncharacterized membrane protein